MSFLSFALKKYATYVFKKRQKEALDPFKIQEKLLMKLLNESKDTLFGKRHNFNKIESYDGFKKQVPIRDYEGLRPEIQKVIDGASDVLFPGRPLYFAQTSGTTSGTKYIPVTKSTMLNNKKCAEDAILSYIHHSGNTDPLLGGKVMHMQSSPELTEKNGVLTGGMGGISFHHVAGYVKKNRLPSYEANIIKVFDKKVERIVEETIDQDLRMLAGVPAWMIPYFEKILQVSGKKTIQEVFPNLSLLIHGGINFDPYRATFDRLIGRRIDCVDTCAASEGWMSYQDNYKEKGMLLCVNAGVFFEFIPVNEIFDANPTRLSVKDVSIGVNYAIILNTAAGFWGYNIGDTVKFTSLKPHRILVTGRIKQFMSAFSEHIILEEVEDALSQASEKFGFQAVDFHVATKVNPEQGLPYHEWFIEFFEVPNNLKEIAAFLDLSIQQKNMIYKDLVLGKVVRPVVLRVMPRGSFILYMKKLGKLGGQNKPIRLANDRKKADFLTSLII